MMPIPVWFCSVFPFSAVFPCSAVADPNWFRLAADSFFLVISAFWLVSLSLSFFFQSNQSDSIPLMPCSTLFLFFFFIFSLFPVRHRYKHTKTHTHRFQAITANPLYTNLTLLEGNRSLWLVDWSFTCLYFKL